jgi:hypothetical protein
MCTLKLVAAAAAAAIAFHSSLPAEGQSMTTRLDFEDAAPGALPAGFRAGLTGKGRPVQWSVVEDTSAPAGPKVLAETSGDRTDYRFPIAVLQGAPARDVEVTVRFKPVSGRVDQAAGVIVRVRDDNNYYVARANALENNVRLYRVVRGNRQQFAGVDVPVASGRWQQFGLRVEGDRFTVSLDGKLLFEATDRTFMEAGQVGLWTKADSLTYFDELVVRPLP